MSCPPPWKYIEIEPILSTQKPLSTEPPSNLDCCAEELADLNLLTILGMLAIVLFVCHVITSYYRYRISRRMKREEYRYRIALGQMFAPGPPATGRAGRLNFSTIIIGTETAPQTNSGEQQNHTLPRQQPDARV